MVPKIVPAVYVFAVIAGVWMVSEVEALKDCTIYYRGFIYHHAVTAKTGTYWTNPTCDGIQLVRKDGYFEGDEKGTISIN